MSAHKPHDIATRSHGDAVELFHIAAADGPSRDHRRLLETLESVGSICCGLGTGAVHRSREDFFGGRVMDWYADCSYEPDRKRHFHTTARTCLRRLAQELGFATGSFEIRSNKGGIAVSGEIILHHNDVYVLVCQPATRADTGILIRTCAGRRDYAGGRNHFEPLALLDDIPALATRVRAVMAGKSGATRAA